MNRFIVASNCGAQGMRVMPDAIVEVLGDAEVKAARLKVR